MDAPSRTDPPYAADEATTLRGYLDYHRETLRVKTAGLDHEQLARTHPPSEMTLGGMLKHLALVESNWFDMVLAGEEMMPPFDTADWDADWDWDWHSATADTPQDLRDLLDRAIARADRRIDAALAAPAGLDGLSVRKSRDGVRHFSLRWILLHMIEEYARHNGHADLLREAIDGSTGE